MGRAHPRACGENSNSVLRRRSSSGSSPRVRGKLSASRTDGRLARLIPARAGKTLSSLVQRYHSAAHPRACGENRNHVLASGIKTGSSPRVRGKQRRRKSTRSRMGLIPARAGKTPQGHPRPSWRWAHPRACGENASLVVAESQNPGSSPRVRGKHWLDARVNAIQRLIPARAGKTPVGLAQSPGTQAHPRACGENFSLYDLQNLLPGSSPRVRGKLNMYDNPTSFTGLIPARAGKTAGSWSGCGSGGAHPRACGENSSAIVIPLPVTGSSPRVRGKRTG